MTDHDPCDVPVINADIEWRRDSPFLLPLAVLLISLVVVVGPLVLIVTVAEACLCVARGLFHRLTLGCGNQTGTVGTQDRH